MYSLNSPASYSFLHGPGKQAVGEGDTVWRSCRDEKVSHAASSVPSLIFQGTLENLPKLLANFPSHSGQVKEKFEGAQLNDLVKN